MIDSLKFEILRLARTHGATTEAGTDVQKFSTPLGRFAVDGAAAGRVAHAMAAQKGTPIASHIDAKLGGAKASAWDRLCQAYKLLDACGIATE